MWKLENHNNAMNLKYPKINTLNPHRKKLWHHTLDDCHYIIIYVHRKDANIKNNGLDKLQNTNPNGDIVVILCILFNKKKYGILTK